MYKQYPQHQNAYAYAVSNPSRWTDPDGRLNLDCARRVAQPALAKAAQYAITPSFPGGQDGLHNGPADAFRHCYWSCLMVKECGWDTAYAAGTGHELWSAGRSPIIDTPAESAQDLTNNREGRGCGRSCGGCDTCCLQRFFDGELQEKLPW
ncbi:MAG: DUF6973 domain-containing protein [Thermoanaerobaculia bacterium]